MSGRVWLGRRSGGFPGGHGPDLQGGHGWLLWLSAAWNDTSRGSSPDMEQLPRSMVCGTEGIRRGRGVFRSGLWPIVWNREPMYKSPGVIVVFFPLVAFVVAAATELGASRAIGDLRRLVAPFVGIAVLGLDLNPGIVGVATPEASEVLSHVLVMVASVVSCSGVFVTYSRRSSAIWVALGGLTLVFVSMFARIYY